MVYFMEHPINIWMMTGGTPILGNLHLFLWIVFFGGSQWLGEGDFMGFSG